MGWRISEVSPNLEKSLENTRSYGNSTKCENGCTKHAAWWNRANGICSSRTRRTFGEKDIQLQTSPHNMILFNPNSI